MNISSVLDKSIPLDTSKNTIIKKYFRPNPEYDQYWDAVYTSLNSKLNPTSPLLNSGIDNLNPYFGYFGEGLNSATKHSGYFNTGLCFDIDEENTVVAIADGILEYSGFSLENGNYVLLSHDMCTEDDFVLHSMYMHHKKNLVGFTKYQKMLRELSLANYPNLEIQKGEVIGVAGKSGLAKDASPILYFVTSLRKKDGTTVFIDPARVVFDRLKVNIV